MIRPESVFNIRMAIGLSLTLLTLLTIGTLADNGEIIRVDYPQGLGCRCQMSLPSLRELRNHLKSQFPISPQELKLERLPLGPAIPCGEQVIGTQSEARPRFVLAPITEELGGSLSTALSAHLLKVDQTQPKSPIWIIRVPPSQSPLYLVLVPQTQKRTLNSFAQLLADYQKSKSQNLYSFAQLLADYQKSKSQNLYSFAQLLADYQKSKSENLGKDRFMQSLYKLTKIESEIQTLAAQIRDLKSASETISNIAEGSSAQFREDKSLLQSLLQSLTKNFSAQALISESQFQLQDQTVKSLDQSQLDLSQSGSQSQFQNQTVLNSAQSYGSLSQSQLQNQTVNSLDQSQYDISRLGSQSQFQNQTLLNSDQSHAFLSQSQLQNQTVMSLDQSQYDLSQSGSQSQFQNQTLLNSPQSDAFLSQSQVQNQTVHNLDQSNVFSSLSQLQNQTVNSLDQTHSQSGAESQLQNQTQNNSVQSHASQSESQLQNQTVNNSKVYSQTGSESDSLSQSQLHNQSSIITTINSSLLITTTTKYVVENPPPFFTLSDIKVDSDLQTFGLIEKYGYPSETRYFYTEDGYKLCMHRIPRPGAPSVLLVHGLMASSVSWVQFGPSNGLAYILYRKGYDVWMLNTRGNIYSREHKNENLKPREYWDFSFHEIGKFDLPAAIDLILQISQQPKVQYIGHSQGSTVFFAMCSERPEYASKVNLMQSLAPTVYLQDTQSPVLKFLGMFRGKFSMLVNLLGGYEISSKTRLIKQFRDHICTTSELASRICTIFDFVLCGFDWKGFNETLTPIVAAHASQGASAKQIYHYAQMQGKLNFQLFDHGRILNHIRYHENEPPSYNLSLAVTKVVIHHSSRDWLGVDSDVGHLKKMLPNVVESRKVEGFAHFDFTISKDVRPLVYDSVLGHLKNHL